MRLLYLGAPWEKVFGVYASRKEPDQLSKPHSIKEFLSTQ